MPPLPYGPTILVCNSDNERDADDHQDWCLRNLRNPVLGRARKLPKHAPLELVCACFTGPLPYSPWSPRHCCPSKTRQLDAPSQPLSSDRIVWDERIGATKVAPQQQQKPDQLLAQTALSEASQLHLKSTRSHSTSPKTDTVCHQPVAKSRQGPMLTRHVSTVRTNDSEMCSSASQLLATMLSGESDKDEPDRVPVTPEVLQSQGISQASTSPEDQAEDFVTQLPQSEAASQSPVPSGRSIVRSSPPIVFDDNADSPANGGHGVSSALPPQPGSSFAPESLSESLKPDLGDQHLAKLGRGDAMTRKKRKTTASSAEERERDQQEEREQEQEGYQSQEDCVLNVQEESRGSMDRTRHTDAEENAKAQKRKRREMNRPTSASQDHKASSASRNVASVKHASVSRPSPVTPLPTEPQSAEHSSSTSFPDQRRTARWSSPSSSTLSLSMPPSSPLTNMSDPPQSLDGKQSVHGSEASSSSSSPARHTQHVGKGIPTARNQSSLDVHLMDIEGYLERDLKGYASRLSY